MFASLNKYISKTINDPYPLFFFFGAIFSMLGSLVWLVYFAGASVIYPNISHPRLMIGGFILMFVSGFLLTAVPNFTGTRSSSLGEIISIFIPILISQFFVSQGLEFNLLQYFAIWSLSIFTIKRVMRRKNNPPPSFVFIGAALVCLHLSLLIKIVTFLNLGFGDYSFLAQRLYTEASTLFLIFGVGSKVIPMIKGFSGEKVQNKIYVYFALACSVLLITYLVENEGPLLMASFIRNSIFTLMAIFLWKTHRTPVRVSKLNTCLRIAEFMIIAGLWMPMFFPQYYIHFKHMLFIGGFGLITFLISTRVIFAHGKAGVEHEKTSRFYWPLLILCFLALAFRVSLAFVNDQQSSVVLSLSASIWILIGFLWLYGFYSKSNRMLGFRN